MSVKRVKFKENIERNYYNFSFNENIIKKLYENSDKSLDYKIFKNNIYLKVTRNYLRYRWLIIYLLGCTSVVHETFNYDSVKDYVDSINKFIDEDLIDSHKELYAPIRLKAKNPKSFLNSLLDDGINYLEYRSIDINPFEKCGISLDYLYFLNLFNIFLLIDELNLNQNKIIDDMIDKIKDHKKTYTYKMIENSGIKIPSGLEFFNVEDAISYVSDLVDKPIVIKPKSTNFGTGINIFPKGANKESIIKAFEIAFKYDSTVLVEEFIKGKEYRFLVIGDKVVGILHRVPANVIGDGEKSIKELVEIKNQSPLRGKGYKTPLEKIDLDENAKLFLNQKGLDFDYVPKKDEVIYLRENSNISTGGDSIDYTDFIPQRFKDIAVNSSKAIGAKICGVDMMIEDYTDESSDYGIIELNFNPAIHIHSYPYIGKERKVAEEILRLLEFIY